MAHFTTQERADWELFSRSYPKLGDPIILGSALVLKTFSNGRSLTRSRTSYIYVEWLGGQVPPGVKFGQRVQFFGVAQTYNAGNLVLCKLARLLSSTEALRITLAACKADAIEPETFISPKTFAALEALYAKSDLIHTREQATRVARRQSELSRVRRVERPLRVRGQASLQQNEAEDQELQEAGD
jgi:hypothetical protein